MVFRPLLWLLLVPCLALPGCKGGGSGTDTAPPTGRVYVLGSSFSFDALPQALDGEPQWQIYCARDLTFIFENPNSHCVATSTPWPDVLDRPATVFDVVAFQPIPRSTVTLDDDVSHILYWLDPQPLSTVGVIHATWPSPGDWEEDLHHDPDDDLDTSSYAIDYYYALLDELQRLDPGRTYRLTRSNEMLDFIRHDLTSPIVFDDLFRDDGGHMSWEGRYLQHNALRQAMGQEVGVDSTAPGVDPVVRDYLDSVVDLYPPL